MNHKIFVSILIPCYNRAKEIGKVIQSLLQQSRLPDEIIVVDDASTDNSVDVIKEFPVKLIKHPENRGPANARNTAFKSSKGDIVIFLDSDAIAHVNMVENLVAIYGNSELGRKLGGVGGRGIETCNEGLANIWRATHANQSHGLNYKSDVQYLFGLCCSYRRDVFEKVHGFDNYFPVNAGEDLDIGLRIHKAGYKLSYTPEAVVDHLHCDTVDSIKKLMYRWSYWSYVALRKNRAKSYSSYLGLVKQLFFYSIQDLFILKNIELFRLNMSLLKIKKHALIDARKKERIHEKTKYHNE